MTYVETLDVHSSLSVFKKFPTVFGCPSATSDKLKRFLQASHLLQQRFSSTKKMSNILKVRKPEPARIEYKGMKFLITYRPSEATMDKFVEELKKHRVKDVVRVCESSYSADKLAMEGITVIDMPFDDGTSPPEDIIRDWFRLIKERFREDPSTCIAVHCVAGLGRAPVLVALALIELGMKYEDAVALIRERRRGAINSKQLCFLEKYHPKYKLKKNGGHKMCCVQ